MLRRRSRGPHNILYPGDDVPMLFGHVVLLGDIVFQIVKLNRAVRIFRHVLADAFPVAHSDRLPFPLLVKFPVKKLVLFLF